MKIVFLASKMLRCYSWGDNITLMGIRVTNQCYNALKSSGYLLSRNEREHLYNKWEINDFSPGPTYGCYNPYSFKQVRKFLGSSLLTAAQVRALQGALIFFSN